MDSVTEKPRVPRLGDTLGFTPHERELLTNGLGSHSFADRLRTAPDIAERARIYRDELYRIVKINDENLRSRILDIALRGAFNLRRLQNDIQVEGGISEVSDWILKEIQVHRNEEGEFIIGISEEAQKGLMAMIRYHESVGEAQGFLDAARSIWDVLWPGYELDEILRTSPLFNETPDSGH